MLKNIFWYYKWFFSFCRCNFTAWFFG